MKRHRLSLVTAPTVEPVTLQELKAHLRLDDSTAEDSLLSGLITVAREMAEDYTRRALITQTWKMFMDSFPGGRSGQWWDGVREGALSELVGVGGVIEIPLGPLQSVTHIKTYDDSDVATTFSSTNYRVSAYSSERGRISLRDGQTWPTFERNIDGIEIQFVAGYGATGASVPGGIKEAIKAEAAYRYEHRGDCDAAGMASSSAMSLLSRYKIMEL